MALSEELPIYKAGYDLLERVVDASKDLPKFYRYSLGSRMVELCLDILCQVYRANMKQSDREEALTDLLVSHKQLQLLLRVCYHQKAISSGRYSDIIKLMDSVGRQATAWKNKN